MVIRTIGAGSKDPVTARDSEGRILNGKHSYKRHLPPGIPATLFWDVTLYNVPDGTMPETDQMLPSKNGFENTAINDDGSIDLHFGPRMPDGVAETNFIKTVNGRHLSR